MPSLTLGHDSNRAKASDVFINDLSSRNEMEARRREKEQELKAKTAAEELGKERAGKAEQLEKERVEKAAAQALELETLRERKAVLERNNAELDKRFMDSVQHVQKLNAENAEQRAAMIKYFTEKENADKNAIAEAMKPLDNKNNLDPGCHGRIAYIVNLTSRTAVDLGGTDSNGGYPHGWEFGLNNPWQQLKLEKTDPDDRHSAWTISCGGRYMELLAVENGSPMRCSDCRKTDSDGQKGQEWLIGRISNTRGYMVQNVRFGKVLDLLDPNNSVNGMALRGYSRNETDTCQVYGIILT